jgi:hypothetical protein
LACPRCGYSLRGLTEPRCPECGFAFTGAELLDAKRDQHPWLFEHGRGRNVWTFTATFARTGFPRRFWETVTPASRVHVGRLLLYWMLSRLPIAAMLIAPPCLFYFGFHASPIVVPQPWSIGFLHGHRPNILPANDEPARLTTAAAICAWPGLTFAALLLFRGSMSQAKVHCRDVLRAVVYGFDFGLIPIAIAIIAFWPAADAARFRSSLSVRPSPLGSCLASSRLPSQVMPVLLTLSGCGAVGICRLTAACGRYLRFDRPFLAVVSVQGIIMLIVGIVLVRTVGLSWLLADF